MARRKLLLIGAVILAAACVVDTPSDAPVSLSFLADFNIPYGTSFASLEGERLGGISAVSYNSRTGRWLALSDARRSSRFYELEIDYQGGALSVSPHSRSRLRDGRGEGYAADVLDPEGVSELPWGTLIVSTEPDSREEPVEQAKLLEFDREGNVLRYFDVPDRFLIHGWPPKRGMRNNQGFEALTITPDGSRVFVGVEGTLLQDGAGVGFDAAGFSRILELVVNERELTARAEYVYPVGPESAVPGLEGAEVSAGLVELLALSSTRALALERVFVFEPGREVSGVNRIRIFDVDLSNATDVSGIDDLGSSSEWQPVHKELVMDFDDIVSEFSPGYQALDNFEAMGLGPALPGGGRSLLVVSDDNFQEHQRTAFLLFRLEGP